MNRLTRLIPITGSAAATTFSLFYMMHGLIASGEVNLDPPKDIRLVDYIAPVDDPKPPRIKDRLTPPVKVEIPETEEWVDLLEHKDIPGPIGFSSRPQPPKVTDHHLLTLTQTDGERIPVVRVAPQYPRRCQEKGLSGWVTVDFSVNEYGAVENPVVAGADSSGCFNRTALKAITRFKYKPTIINGQPQPSHGVRYRFSFNMEEG